MRKVRGAKALYDYPKKINCPISESTIYRMIKQNKIPFFRPVPWILIFDLDEIDAWFSGGRNNANGED